MIVAQMPMTSTSYGIRICMSLSYYTNNYARKISKVVSYKMISYLVNRIIDVYWNMYPLNISNRYDRLYIFGKAMYRNCSNSLVTTQFIYTKDPPNEIVL